MNEEPTFEDVKLTRGNLRVTWEYIGEGAMGEYNRDDEQDEPLLRFSCHRRQPSFDEMGEQVGWAWVEMDDASYCTYMPLHTPLNILAGGAAMIMAEIEKDSYKKPLERLTHMIWDPCYAMPRL